jgi:tight adherence protein B
MGIGVVVVLFLVCFGTILLCVGFASSYFKSQQTQQIRNMLRKAEETPLPLNGTEFLKPAEASGGFARLLRQFEFSQKLDRLIEQSGEESDATKLFVSCGIAAGIGYIIGLRFSFLAGSRPLTAACIGAVVAVLPFWNLLRKRKKQFAQFEEQLPEALDFIARSMRAGHGFTIAMEMLAADSPDPLGRAFRIVSNDVQLGSPLQQALEKLTYLFPMIDVRFFVSTVLLQQETGGNLGEVLAKLALIIRERFRLKGQVKAASAHGRITGMVLVLMPVAVTLFMMATSPQYLVEMADDKTGRVMIYGAIFGQIIGYFVIKKIINIKV